MIKSVSQYTSPCSITICLQRQPISRLQCDCCREVASCPGLVVVAVMVVFVLIRLTFFICHRHSSSSLPDKSRRQPNQCKQRLHVLEENANIFCQCSNKCPTCNKALDKLWSVHLFLCLKFCFALWFKRRKFMYANQEIYCCCCHHPLNSYTRGYKLFGWLKQVHQQCVHKNIHQYTLADEWWRNFNNSLLNVTCNDFGFAFVQLLTRQKILYHFYHQSNVETMLIRFSSGKLIQHRLVCLLKKLANVIGWGVSGFISVLSLWQLKQTEYRHSKRKVEQRKLYNICSLPIRQKF